MESETEGEGQKGNKQFLTNVGTDTRANLGTAMHALVIVAIAVAAASLLVAARAM